MQGLTQDYQLTLPAIMRRAEQLYGEREIVTRKPDKSFHRYTYADFVARAKKLAVALKGLGVEDGDRVGTLAWNTYQHLEAYFGVRGGAPRDAGGARPPVALTAFFRVFPEARPPTPPPFVTVSLHPLRPLSR